MLLITIHLHIPIHVQVPGYTPIHVRQRIHNI